MSKRNPSLGRDDLLTPSEIEALRREFEESYRRISEEFDKQESQKREVPQDNESSSENK